MRGPRALAGRVVQEAGVPRLRALRARLESLEDAIEENSPLDRGLDAQLADLEDRLRVLAADAVRARPATGR